MVMEFTFALEFTFSSQQFLLVKIVCLNYKKYSKGIFRYNNHIILAKKVRK